MSEPTAAGIAPRPTTGPEGDLPSTVAVDELVSPSPSSGRPHRILMTTTGHGAAWSHAVDLAGALGRCDIEVALATLVTPPTNGQLEEALRHPNLQVYPSRFGADGSDDSWDELERAADWLLRLEDHVEPDLVHLHAYPYGAARFRTPVMLEGHDCPLCRRQALRSGAPSLSWERYRRAVTRALGHARMVVAPTSAALEELSAQFGRLPSTRVIPLGRSPQRLQPLAKEELVLSAGCFGDEANGLSTLEGVAREIDWPVAVLVDGEVAEERTARSVRLVENRSAERLASWYGRASIFVLPCRYEPAGLSVLEAALAGCALVLGDVPSLRETWQGAALFVDPDDPADLKRTLDLLVSEPKGRHGLAQQARARALLFSPERRAASFLEAYAQVLRDEAPVGRPLDVEVS